MDIYFFYRCLYRWSVNAYRFFSSFPIPLTHSIFLFFFFFFFLMHWPETPVTKQNKKTNKTVLTIFVLFLFLLLLFRATPAAYVCSKARDRIRATAAGLRHSHSNVGSKLHLWPTPQLRATPDPWPTEQGQGLNPQSHGY